MELQNYLQHVLNELTESVAQIDADAAERVIEELLAAQRIFIAGAGRSGLIMCGFAMRLMHLEFTVHVVGHVTTPAIGAGDLLLIGSGSGKTASLCSYAQTAKELGAGVALITARGESPLAQWADPVLVLPTPTPKADVTEAIASIQPMASLFEQTMLLLLDTISLLIMERRNQNDMEAFRRHANLE